MRPPVAVVLMLLALAAIAARAGAHETRPGYLQVREVAPGRYEVLWKQPARGELRLRLDPVFPEPFKLIGAVSQELLPDAVLSRFTIACEGGLTGKKIRIAGLEATLTDVLVRIRHLDGREETHLLRPSATSVTVGGLGGTWERAAAYLSLGVEHILLGVDHLLFVLGLLLIVRGRWMLLKTITSFTIAHSITLAVATLGWASAPAAAINAGVALSILFLGPEVGRAESGGTSLTIRHPWIVAFAFGLLHGFGFAGGLAAMGLPRGEIPLALLLFNVGVEAGQIAFVGLVLLLARSFRTLEIRWSSFAVRLPGWTIGSLGAFWTIQRAAALFGVAP